MEQWKEVEGYEGFYMVSSSGKIKGVDRLIRCSRGGFQLLKGKIISPQLNNAGYYTIRLSKFGSKKSFLVHRIVAAAFVENKHQKPAVNHKDSNRQNNNADNLEWVTYSENTMHGVSCGRIKGKIGGTRPRFTPSQVIGIRKDQRSSRVIADEFGVNTQCINRIRKGIRWAGLTEDNYLTINTN
jgi:hypothetical protein